MQKISFFIYLLIYFIIITIIIIIIFIYLFIIIFFFLGGGGLLHYSDNQSGSEGDKKIWIFLVGNVDVLENAIPRKFHTQLRYRHILCTV